MRKIHSGAFYTRRNANADRIWDVFIYFAEWPEYVLLSFLCALKKSLFAISIIKLACERKKSRALFEATFANRLHTGFNLMRYYIENGNAPTTKHWARVSKSWTCSDGRNEETIKIASEWNEIELHGKLESIELRWCSRWNSILHNKYGDVLVCFYKRQHGKNNNCLPLLFLHSPALGILINKLKTNQPT